MRLINQSFAGLFLALTVLSGCTKKKYYYENNDQQRIVISSEVTLDRLPRVQDLQIAQGQALSLFVTRYNNSASVVYDNINIIANGMGGFSTQIPMYYPIDGTNVDFFAVHPYRSTISLDNTFSFTVEADQRVLSNYLNSDLLYAMKINQERTSSPVKLVFSHRLSKLSITVVNNDGLDLGTLNTVAVLNTMPSTTMNPFSGEITAAEGTPVVISAYGITPSPEVRAEVSDISAIVVPQTIPAGTALFRLTVGAQNFVYTTTSEFTFTPGDDHAIILTITGGQISLESEITPWGPGGSIGGEATPE